MPQPPRPSAPIVRGSPGTIPLFGLSIRVFKRGVFDTQCAIMIIMGSRGNEPLRRRHVVIAIGIATSATLALSACGGTSEYPGEFTVANGDSSFYVGDGPHSRDYVTATCTEDGGKLSITVTESRSGNSFTTTQPEGGDGYAGGTLTLGDGQAFTWVPVEGVTDEEIRTEDHVFEDASQSGAPVLWTGNRITFGNGLRQQTTKVDAGAVYVQTPGEIVCDDSSAG